MAGINIQHYPVEARATEVTIRVTDEMSDGFPHLDPTALEAAVFSAATLGIKCADFIVSQCRLEEANG